MKEIFENKIPFCNNRNVEIVDCGTDTVMLCAKESSFSDFSEYCKKLTDSGAKEISRRTSAENFFAAFELEDKYIYAYYNKSAEAVRVVVGPLATYGEENCGEVDDRYIPSLTLIGQPEFMNCGQGYVVLLPDGRLLVQDGGARYDMRKDFMYEAIKQVAPNCDNIVIAAWFISHPHGDHQDAFEEFIENHGADSNIIIEKVIFNYAKADMYTYMRKDNQFEDNKQLVERIYEKCERYIPKTQVVKAHTGQIFSFGSVTAEILFTVEDFLPAECFDYVNGTSLVVRITVCGQSIMLLADTTHTSGRIMENMFGDYLKSDMVQLAHHGMWASNPSLYERINASIVLWPNLEKVAKGWLNDKAIVTALAPASDVFLSDLGLTALPLPHKLEANKDSVIEKINSL